MEFIITPRGSAVRYGKLLNQTESDRIRLNRSEQVDSYWTNETIIGVMNNIYI